MLSKKLKNFQQNGLKVNFIGIIIVDNVLITVRKGR